MRWFQGGCYTEYLNAILTQHMESLSIKVVDDRDDEDDESTTSGSQSDSMQAWFIDVIAFGIFQEGRAMSGLLFPNNLTRLTKSQKVPALLEMDAPPGMSACTSTYVPRPYISAPLKPPLRPIVVQASLLLLPIILQSLSTSIVTIDAKVNSLTKEPLLTASQMNDILTALGDVVDGQKLLEEVKKKQYKEIWKLKRKVKILVSVE
ncbi:hypothetical protein HAX54_037871 [Datura stramonium]|uniref:Uncharacterized protein n=1 Tax=Datura stramonium TaxID=4076 RepID=A0ABS8SHF3_DATST|nr:hypothetical protein [Datura stramonium]